MRPHSVSRFVIGDDESFAVFVVLLVNPVGAYSQNLENC